MDELPRFDHISWVEEQQRPPPPRKKQQQKKKPLQCSTLILYALLLIIFLLVVGEVVLAIVVGNLSARKVVIEKTKEIIIREAPKKTDDSVMVRNTRERKTPMKYAAEETSDRHSQNHTIHHYEFIVSRSDRVSVPSEGGLDVRLNDILFYRTCCRVHHGALVCDDGDTFKTSLERGPDTSLTFLVFTVIDPTLVGSACTLSVYTEDII